MANGTKLTTGDQLEAVSVNVKRYILSELLTLTNAITEELENFSGATVLDTVPATVDGGLWFEVVDSEPIVKLRYGSNNYQLSPTLIQELDPELTLSTYNVTINSGMELPYEVTASYLGNGTLSVSPSNAGQLVGKALDISVDSSMTITFSVSAAPPYRAATATLNYVYNASSSGGAVDKD